MLTKHSSKDSPYFWKVSRGKDAIPVEEEEMQNVNIAIYVKRYLPDCDQLRKDYLHYMGSNVESFCPIHQFPLTTCVLGRGKKCSNILDGNCCVKAAAYQCPFCGCSTYLCRSCVGVTIPVAVELEREQGMDDISMSNASKMSMKEDVEEDYENIREDLGNELLGSNFEWDEHIQLTNVGETSWDSIVSDTLGNIREEKHSIYDEGQFDGGEEMLDSSSLIMEQMLFTDTPNEYEDDNEDGSVDSVVSEISFDEGSGYIIPTTDAAKTAPTVECKDRRNRFGLHVLLNEHGSLLIRRCNRLKPCRAAKGFLEGIVATSKGQSIPLLYPEAMIFPSIFWKQREDGCYDGAIPIGLWTDERGANSHGFAGIASHMRCRLKNTSLLCSTDPRYIYFAFDSVNNLMARGVDNRLVLKRGFEHMLGPGKLHGQNNDSQLSSDMIDSRRNVNKLAALVREKEPTYFYTHTCNQTEHFGIAPLRKALVDKVQQLLHNHDLSDEDQKELTTSYHFVMSVQIIRTWFKVGRMYMNYIFQSPERPMGNVEKHWWRWEYQDADGNLPHIHCLLWTKEDKHDPEDLKKLQQKIRCSVGSFFLSPAEIQRYVDEGLLGDASEETIWNIKESVASILKHSCQQAGYRCMRRVGAKENDLQCRCVDYYTQNPFPTKYGYKDINANHRSGTLELLVKLGLFDESGKYLDYRLRSGKYVYPADYGEHMSPCNPRLFVAHRSSDNLVITDTYFSCRYLAKYVQGLDENCKVNIKAGKQEHSMVLEEEQVANTKITTGRVMQQEREKKRHQNPIYSGRALGLPEAVGLLLQEQQVFTNASFISIPTVPLEQRPAHEKIARSRWCEDTTKESLQDTRRQVPIGRGNLNFIGQKVRETLGMPSERLFTSMEQIIIQDALSSPVSLDTITLFACHPPELRFVDSPTDYFRFFTRLPYRPPNSNTHESTTDRLLHVSFHKCGWVDGLECQIVVKPQAIPCVINLPLCRGEIGDLFQCLNFIVHGIVVDANRYLDFSQPELEDMHERFVDRKCNKGDSLPLPLFNLVKPTQTNRFLIHLLLSMGRFNNEGELFHGNTMAQFFSNASLITSVENVSEADVLNLTKRFIMEQLLFVPGGTMMFDRFCLAAYEAIRAALLEDSTAACDVPSYLYTSLVEQANESALSFDEEMKDNLATTSSMLPNTPSKEEFKKASKQYPLDWHPNMIRMSDQSEESFLEGVHVCSLSCKAIEDYVKARLQTVKSLIICGGPGTGKTFQLCNGAAYSLSCGLKVTITAAMAERSITLGGRHIHYLFCIPGENINNIHKLIDSSIRGLNKNPERLQFLRTLDVLCIDEMGYLSAELLNVMDTVLRFT